MSAISATKLTECSIAIDTSAGTSVAVLSKGSVLAEVNYLEPMTHSERIGSAIELVLEQSGLQPKEIQQVVVGRGPGPYTGLRVGLAAAAFFARGVQANLVGVCSLDAIAQRHFEENPDQTLPLFVSTDARRQEIFWALYSQSLHSVPVRLTGPSVNKPAEVAAQLGDREYEVSTFLVSASALGKVAYFQSLAGVGPSQDGSPIYLREPDAVPTKPKKVSG